MKWLLIFAVLVGAGATTRPDRSTALQESLTKADARIEAAKSEALSKLRETPEYKSAASDRDAKQKTLNAARENGSPDDRLAASSAFVKADQAVKKMEAEAVGKDKEVADAMAGEAEIKKAIREVEADQRERTIADARAAEDAKRNDPVNVAIENGRVLKGMTESQLSAAVHAFAKDFHYALPLNVYSKTRDEDDVHTIIWICAEPTIGGGEHVVRRVTADLVKGRLVHFVDDRPSDI